MKPSYWKTPVMTRYRDKETGEVVRVQGAVLGERYIVLQDGRHFAWADFRARFEPVEGGDANPS